MPAVETTPQDTRSRIVDAARHLFHSRGYAATSLALVAERAEANPGSLYYFFKTKQALLEAVLERYRQLLGPLVIEPSFATTSHPIERVFAVLESYRRMLVESDFEIGCPIGNLALETRDADPEVRARISANLESWAGAIEGCLGEAAGRLPQDLDRKDLARFVLTVMEGAVVQARGERSIAAFDASVDQLRRYFHCLQTQAKPGKGEKR